VGEAEEYFYVPDCIRFATWNIGTMSGKSAEVVEILHRRKFDVCYCCVQETRWTGSGASAMGNSMSRQKFFWQGCKDGNAEVGFLISDSSIDRIVLEQWVRACQGKNSSGRVIKTIMQRLGFLFQKGRLTGLLM